MHKVWSGHLVECGLLFRTFRFDLVFCCCFGCYSSYILLRTSPNPYLPIQNGVSSDLVIRQCVFQNSLNDGCLPVVSSARTVLNSFSLMCCCRCSMCRFHQPPKPSLTETPSNKPTPPKPPSNSRKCQACIECSIVCKFDDFLHTNTHKLNPQTSTNKTNHQSQLLLLITLFTPEVKLWSFALANSPTISDTIK